MDFWFDVVVAFNRADYGIGNKGALPWKSIPEDMERFRTITTSHKINVVIMGRKTYESIPRAHRPLPGRTNIVLTRKENYEDKGIINGETPYFCNSFDEAVGMTKGIFHRASSVDCGCYVIGGAEIYNKAMDHEALRMIYITEIEFEEKVACDKYFRGWNLKPLFSNQISTKTENVKRISFISCINFKSGKVSSPMKQFDEEYQYMKLINRCIEKGNEKNDRTGTGTLSLFAETMTFDLSDNVLPLLTTKRVPFVTVLKELLWFISGSTNAKILADQNVHIWDGNGSRGYLDSVGLKEREEGDIGPVYGHQWRHFGAVYKDMHHDYTGEGVDQLARCIHLIKNEPESRRIIMSAWNPPDLKLMALPPCHMFVQFYVNDGKLDCFMHQRSCDMGLGVPFNIASYSILTHMIAQVCDLKPGKFIHSLGDYHVYKDHVKPLLTQLDRVPRPFPTLSINKSVKNIDDFKIEDFRLNNYAPHPTIKMKMSV